MEEYPKTVLEFEEWFATEEACREYLRHLRWPEGFRCPRCTGERAWAMGPGLMRCTHCDVQTSVTAGTIFQDTRLPLRLWRTSRSRGKLFYRLAQQVVAVDPVPAKKILGRRSKP